MRESLEIVYGDNVSTFDRLLALSVFTIKTSKDT